MNKTKTVTRILTLILIYGAILLFIGILTGKLYHRLIPSL